jgi:uncharacterized membrane protein YhfC
MQVSVFSIIFMAISAFISITAPIVLFIIFYKKYNAKVIPMLTGMAGFVLFALILEQLIHLIVFTNFALREQPFIFIIYGIFMAGIFEETARFISFKLLKKKYNGIETGLAYGIGHGGIESIVVGGLSMVNTIVVSTMINTGNIETITSALQGDALEQTITQLTMLSTAPSYSFLAGGIERIFAIGIHTSLSIIVFYSVYGKNKLWLYPLAILLHAIMDIPAAAMQAGVIKNVYVVELFAFISAILFIIIARYIHGKLKQSIMET